MLLSYKFFILTALLTFSINVGFGQQWVLKFDPSKDKSYVDCGKSTNYDLDAFTIETWVFVNNWSGNYILSSESWNNENGAMGFAFRFNGDGLLEMNYGTGDWETVTTSNGVIKLQQWQHVAVTTGSDGSVNIYVDGNEVGNGAISKPMLRSITNIYMGEGSMWQGRGLDGMLSDFRIWNTKRTSSEIQSDMGSKLSGQEDGLLANWLLDEGQGDILEDLTGSHNLTKGTGTVWVEKDNLIVSGLIKVLVPGKDSVLVSIPNQTISLWEATYDSGLGDVIFSIVDEHSAYLVYESKASSYQLDTLMITATGTDDSKYQTNVIAESYDNKYQYYGELLLDKIHDEFYNKTNGLYAEEIGSSSQHLQATSFLWPASHMLRALKNAWTLNPKKYEQTFTNYLEAFEQYRTTKGGVTGYAVLPGQGNQRFYDDNGLLVIQFADIYDRKEDNTTLEKLITAYTFNNDIHDSNMGIPQHEEQLGYGMFYSMAVNQTSYGSAKLYQITNENQYLNDALAYYTKQNDYTVKLKDASTQLFNQFSFYKNGSWSLAGSVNGTQMNGGGYRAYQTSVVVQNAIVLYQITNDQKYLDDAKQMMNACLNQWYSAGGGLRENSFWGGDDMVDALLELYAETEDEKWFTAAKNIVEFLSKNGRDKRGYYPSSYDDALGDWHLYRTNLNPSNVSLMGQAAAASSFLHVAIYSSGIISSVNDFVNDKPRNELMVYPNPVSSGDKLNIVLPANKKVSQIRIYNQSGQVVDFLDASEIYSNSFIIKEKLKTGVYFLQVVMDSNSFQTKLLIH